MQLHHVTDHNLGMQIDIRIKDQHLRRLTADSKAIRKATARSLNEILRAAKAQSARDIRQEITLKAGIVKKHIVDTKAKPNMPVDSQKAVLSFSRKGIPLFDYNARPKVVGKSKLTGKPLVGVTVQVKKSRQLVKGGFIATMGSGKRGVFMRTTKRRLPIAMKFGPALGDVATNEGVTGPMSRLIEAKYAEAFARNLRFYMGK